MPLECFPRDQNVEVRGAVTSARVTRLARTTRLTVHVDAPADRDLDPIHARPSRLAGRLRAEVASSIHRKKTPSLVFVVVPR